MRRMTPQTARTALAFALILMPMTAWADDPIGQVKTETGGVTLERHGITFADNSMMSLGPDSRLALDQFRFDTTTHDGVFDSSLQKGTLAVRSGQIVHQTPEAMHIRTPAALLGVRGTEFVVRADGKS